MGAIRDWLFGAEQQSWSERRIEEERQRIRAVYAALDGPYGSNAELYNSTVRLIEDAKLPDTEKFAKRTLLRLLETCDELKLPYPQYDLTIQMAGAAAGLYYAEGFQHLPPNPALYSSTGHNKALGTIRDVLINLNRKAAQPARTLETLQKTIVSSFIAIIRHLPPLALEDPNDDDDSFEIATISLLDLLPNAAELIEEALRPLDSEEARDIGLFRLIKNQIKTNIGDEEIDPKASPQEIAHFYLRDTPLERLFTETQVPFVLPNEQRFAGHWIIAPPGRGKTTLLHSMVHDDLSKDAAVVLIDSKGDLINPVKRLQCIKDRLLLIEPDPESAFALNPLDVSHASVVQVVSLIEYIMAGLLDAKFTALQSTLFRNVVPAIIEATPNPTLDDFKRVMVKGLPTLDKVSPYARQFFENRDTGFYSKTYESTRKEVVWRLDYLMSNPTLRSMFSATHTKLDMGKEIDAGKVIIINNSKAILGDEGAEFFGRFFIALIARAAQQRAGKPSAKKPCYVFIDECQSVIAKDARILVLLDECRSQQIALILSHQRTAQLTAPVLDAVANCAIRMANSDDEARYLSDKLRMTTDELRSLPRGTFGTFVRDQTASGIQLRVSKIDLDSLPKMTIEEMAVIRERMRSDFSSDPATPKSETALEQPPAGPAPQAQSTAQDDPGEPAPEWGLRKK